MLLLSLVIFMQSAAVEAPIPEARWKRVPSIYERALAYPQFAGERRVSGTATLKCRINDIGAPTACSVFSETPAGHGFGKALMSLRSKMSFHRPAPEEGPWVLITVGFDADPKKALYLH